jgi:hypothetical protein
MSIAVVFRLHFVEYYASEKISCKRLCILRLMSLLYYSVSHNLEINLWMFALLRKQKLLLEGHFAEVCEWWNDEFGLQASLSRWCQSCDCVQQSTQVGSLRDKLLTFASRSSPSISSSIINALPPR